ncbi:integral membrane protein ccma involved in cell shape determination [hydrocarbon metagenome]|uniref:Integral membrane protein ccma involved in cell shape determination n=1 Tax=hydrocarbon metagenome TaxID=938273 RepID=A0A0W8G0E7_9ZZZZ
MAHKNNSSSSVDVSILSSGVKIEGKIYSEGNMRIDGKVIGDVTVNGNLTLGESSEVKGDVRAMNVTLTGNIQGSVEANEKVILEANSRLVGELTAKILVIEEGAKFDGKSNMNSGKPKSETTDVSKK